MSIRRRFGIGACAASLITTLSFFVRAEAPQTGACTLSSSRFWKQIAAVCPAAGALRGAASAIPEEERGAVNQVLAYCDSHAEPEFATLALTARQQTLATV